MLSQGYSPLAHPGATDSPFPSGITLGLDVTTSITTSHRQPDAPAAHARATPPQATKLRRRKQEVSKAHPAPLPPVRLEQVAAYACSLLALDAAFVYDSRYHLIASDVSEDWDELQASSRVGSLIRLCDGPGTTSFVYEDLHVNASGAAAWFEGWRHPPALLACLPIDTVGGQTLGRILLLNKTNYQMHSRRMRDAASLASMSAAMMLNHPRYAAAGTVEHDQLRRLYKDHTDKLETERRRIAMALHDELGQTLAASRMLLSRIERRTTDQPPEVLELIQQLDQMLERSRDAMRRIVADLRPAELDALGLVSALEQLAQRSASASNHTIDVDIAAGLSALIDRQSRQLQTNVYRFFQESLTNALRHATASRIRISMHHDNDHLVLDVSDDGAGFNPADLNRHERYGLLGMRERMGHLGGSVMLIRTKSQQTSIQACIPLQRMSHQQETSR